MKLSKSILCIDCDNVFEAGQRGLENTCPVCGSTSTMPLTRWVMPLGPIRIMATVATLQKGGAYAG